MDITWGLAQYLVLLFSLSVHEFAHAWTAYLSGDDTARLQGRMTLNPFAHIDPVGTVVLPLMGIFAGTPLFGWAKPVPVNPRNFHKYRRDDMLVSLAGIIANLCIATAAAVVIRVLIVLGRGGLEVPEAVLNFLGYFFQINVLLAIFNLIPIPPLDGFQFGKHFLPMQMRWNAHKMYQYGPFLLMLLVFTGAFRVILFPLMNLAYRVAFMGL